MIAARATSPALSRLVGGLLCVGIPGTVADPALLERLRALGTGGVILFGRNVTTPEATRALADELHAALGDDLPPSICIDQEGGRVARLRRDVPLPSMMALGATHDAELAERAGGALASVLHGARANVNFAPVLDLALNPSSSMLGTRSLGDDAERVAELGAALVRGLEAGGVVATPKHFPGHGATPADSHVSLPVVSTEYATLREREWLPFARAFAAGARAVMSAHVLVPALDPEVPATLSPRILRDVLRGELGFTGVVFTDCLEMAGVAARYGTARAGVMALAAGADALLVSHDLGLAEAVRDAVVAAVTAGELPLARVEDAAARMTALRRSHADRSAAGAVAVEPDSVAREIARRAIVRLRGELTLRFERPVTIVSFEGAASDGVAAVTAERPSLNLALRRRRMRSELLRVPLAPELEMVETLLDVVRGQAARTFVILTRRAHLHAAQRAAVNALLGAAPDALVFSMVEPFDAVWFPQARHLACCFDDGWASVEALADILCGRAVAMGRLPVRLDVTLA